MDDAVAISLSGGKSSLWILAAMLHGVLPRPKLTAAFFADTTLEHKWTYEALDFAESLCAESGILFVRCRQEESLADHLLTIGTRTRADHPPLFIKKDGGGRGRAMHRCTREFKVVPMRRAVSAWLRSEGRPKRVVKLVGFAADEAHRATKALGKQDVAWERLEFPAIRLGKTREDQREDLVRWYGWAPDFSMCTICPWKTPDRWLATPAEQLPLVYTIDEAVRDSSSVGLTDGDAYLCDRLIPVEELVRRGGVVESAGGELDHAGCDGGHCFL